VRAHRLAFVGEFGTWEAVARSLARMHDDFAGALPTLPDESLVRLLRYDGDLFRGWLGRAKASAVCAADDRALTRGFDHLTSVYDQVIERLLSLPQTIIHGEFFADNILIAEAGGRVRVCPVDWEMAGVGPGLVDIAGLGAGSWTAEQNRALALAYHGTREYEDTPQDEFLSSLAFCRIQLAVQWAGSAGPADASSGATRWLSEAVDEMEQLGL
jgi:aminoglycoside phosphotransferase (APT) family kinase protein